jgi:hypothetical protein
MHPVNFCTSWRLSGDFILVIADTFSGLGSIPRRETIYPSNFMYLMNKVMCLVDFDSSVLCPVDSGSLW